MDRCIFELYFKEIRRPQRGLQACGIVVASLPLLLSSPRCFQALPRYPPVTRGNPGDSNKINSFIQKSGKVGFPQKSRIWWKFTYQNSLFTENLNGPYGPYEPLLWDISQNKWPKNGVFDENSFFEKMTMSKILGNVVFGGKKAPAGCLHSKTKVLNIIFQ